MRQAGRYLPEYRALKEQHGFLKMVKTPELAAEVTLQPIRRFGFDAAILFSDILVIPEAMGQPYDFRDGGGISMAYALESASQIGALETGHVRERLDYSAQALRLIRSYVGNDTALLGFAGSPWTLATYMVEGGSSDDFSRAKALYFEAPALFNQLMEKLSTAVADYLLLQIESGADAVQIFDSWGAACPGSHYYDMSLRWIARIIGRLPPDTPVIVFAKGMTQHRDALARTGAQVLGIDWAVDMPAYCEGLPGDIAVQGNIDPVLMNGSPDIVHRETHALLHAMDGRNGFIVNLGHGIHPGARIECVESLVETVRNSAKPHPPTGR